MNRITFLFLSIMMIIFLGCLNNDDNSRSSNEVSKESNIIKQPDENYDFPSKVRRKLKWGDLKESNIKMEIEKRHILTDLDFMLLFDKMQGNDINPLQFQNICSFKTGKDEFEQIEILNNAKEELTARRNNLNTDNLCIFLPTIKIGEYDFGKKGFPIYCDTLGNDILGMPKELGFVDAGGEYRGHLILTNIKDKTFPSYVTMNENSAK